MVLVKLLCALPVLVIHILANVTLGPNLIANSYFSTPTISVGNYYDFPAAILGWTCSAYCELVFYEKMCVAANYPSCPGTSNQQAIDLDSNNIFQKVVQNVLILNQGNYILGVTWLLPLKNPIGKTFGIYINNSLVKLTTVENITYIPHIIQINLSLSKGLLQLLLKMLPVTISDKNGVVISSVTLNQVMPYVQQNAKNLQSPLLNSLLTILLGNKLIVTLNQIPGNRVFVNFLTDYLQNLNRIQFYYFHHQNLTYYSYLFLSNINSVMNEKGTLSQYLFLEYNESNFFCSAINEGYTFLQNQLNQKYNYTDSDFLEKNSNGIGFYSNNLDVFYFQIPFILLVYILLSFLFWILFNYRISVMLRQYSLNGILLVIIYEGNVEQFSFYFFAELKYFFNVSFIHKITNGFIVYFYFMLITFVIGGLLWFRHHYKKKVKYFIEGFSVNNLTIMLYALERYIFPLVYGALHSLLIHDLLNKTICLSILEILYINFRIISLKRRQSKRKLYIWIGLMSSFFRLILTVTFYVYNCLYSEELINAIHFIIVILYLLNEILAAIQTLLRCLSEFIKVFKYKFKVKQISRPEQSKIFVKENTKKVFILKNVDKIDQNIQKFN